MARLSIIYAVCLTLGFWPAKTIGQGLGSRHLREFSAERIDAELTAGADAVVRLDSSHFNIETPGSGTYTVKRVITVLTSAGRDEAKIVIVYNKRLRKLVRLTGRLLAADGTKIRDLNDDDQLDVPGSLSGTVFDETRARIIEPFVQDLPFTVEYMYEMAYDGLNGLPGWSPFMHGLPVERSVYELDGPDEIEVRYADAGINLEPERHQDGQRQFFLWRLENLPAFEAEPWGPSTHAQLPELYLGITRFEIEGTTGNMSTWSSFAQWYYRLNYGRGALPDDVVDEVRELVKDAEGEVEIARRVYHYVQDRTRYVSVQLGIGGWQTFPATFVHENRYGDCKALTNYTISLLEAVGIEAFPVLIWRGVGDRDLIVDFPSNQFNHVIAMVPLGTDTLWLESTSQTMPFGHLDESTENRYGLLVSPQGGSLVRTPASASSANRLDRAGEIRLSADGRAEADIEATYSGDRLIRVMEELGHGNSKDRLDWLRSELQIPSFDILSANFDDIEARRDTANLVFRLSTDGYASKTGRRLFVRPNLFGTELSIPPSWDARTQPVIFSYAFSNHDTQRWIIPDRFRIEVLPEPVELDAAFGHFSMRAAEAGDGSIQFVREFEIRQSKIAPEHYDELRSFLLAVRRADEQSMVLVQ